MIYSLVRVVVAGESFLDEYCLLIMNTRFQNILFLSKHLFCKELGMYTFLDNFQL